MVGSMSEEVKLSTALAIELNILECGMCCRIVPWSQRGCDVHERTAKCVDSNECWSSESVWELLMTAVEVLVAVGVGARRRSAVCALRGDVGSAGKKSVEGGGFVCWDARVGDYLKLMNR